VERLCAQSRKPVDTRADVSFSDTELMAMQEDFTLRFPRSALPGCPADGRWDLAEGWLIGQQVISTSLAARPAIALALW
jgi:hypothetical protein